MLVSVENYRFGLPLWYLQRLDFSGKTPFGHGHFTTPLALSSVLVLRLSGDTELPDILIHQLPHVTPTEGIFQAIGEDAIEELIVPHARTPAAAHVGERGTAHAFHATGDDHFATAQGNHLSTQSYRTEPAAAKHVHTHGRCVAAYPGIEGGLTRWTLPQSRREDVAHDYFVYTVRRDARPLQGSPDSVRTQPRSRDVP